METSDLLILHHSVNSMHVHLTRLLGNALGDKTTVIALERYRHQYDWTRWKYRLLRIPLQQKAHFQSTENGQ